MNVRVWIYPAALGASVIVAGAKIYEWRVFHRQMEQRISPIPIQTPDGSEGAIAREANACGVRRLVGVELAERAQIEWEGTPVTALRFVDALIAKKIVGRCERLRLTTDAAEPAIVRIRGEFDRRAVVKMDRSTDASIRNVFFPLWSERRDPPPTVANAAADKKREHEQQMEREKAEKDRLEREQMQQLENKKRELETGLSVSGIVNNGREPIAFVSARAGGQTLMLRGGDTIQDAQVTAIDEKKGEVRLDYLGKFQVSLRLNAAAGATTP